MLSFIMNEDPSAVLPVLWSCFIALVAREIQPEMSLTPLIDQSSSGTCRNQGQVAELPCSYQGTCLCIRLLLSPLAVHLPVFQMHKPVLRYQS